MREKKEKAHSGSHNVKVIILKVKEPTRQDQKKKKKWATVRLA